MQNSSSQIYYCLATSSLKSHAGQNYMCHFIASTMWNGGAAAATSASHADGACVGCPEDGQTATAKHSQAQPGRARHSLAQAGTARHTHGHCQAQRGAQPGAATGACARHTARRVCSRHHLGANLLGPGCLTDPSDRHACMSMCHNLWVVKASVVCMHA